MPARATISPNPARSNRLTFQTFESIELGNAHLLKTAIGLGNRYLIAKRNLTRKDPANGESADILAVVEIRHEQLQRITSYLLWRRNCFDDLIKERSEIC